MSDHGSSLSSTELVMILLESFKVLNKGQVPRSVETLKKMRTVMISLLATGSTWTCLGKSEAGMSEAVSPLQPLEEMRPAEARYLLGERTETISYCLPFLLQHRAMANMSKMEVMTAMTTAIITMLRLSLVKVTISVLTSQLGLTKTWW